MTLDHNHSFDDLIFDAEKLAFAGDRGSAANPKATVSHKSSEVQNGKAVAAHPEDPSLSPFWDKLLRLRSGFGFRHPATWTSAAMIFCVAMMAVVAYIIWSGRLSRRDEASVFRPGSQFRGCC